MRKRNKLLQNHFYCVPLWSASLLFRSFQEIKTTVQHKISIETNWRKLEGMEQAVVFWHTFPSLCVGQMRIEVTRHGGLPPPNVSDRPCFMCASHRMPCNPASSTILQNELTWHRSTELLELELSSEVCHAACQDTRLNILTRYSTWNHNDIILLLWS